MNHLEKRTLLFGNALVTTFHMNNIGRSVTGVEIRDQVKLSISRAAIAATGVRICTR
jgi:hypothetical protein